MRKDAIIGTAIGDIVGSRFEFNNFRLIFEQISNNENNLMEDIYIILSAIKYSNVIKIKYLKNKKEIGYKSQKDKVIDKLRNYGIEYDEFRLEFDSLHKKTGDVGLVSLIKCNKCRKINYVHTLLRDKVICPNCNGEDVITIVNTNDICNKSFDVE